MLKEQPAIKRTFSLNLLNILYTEIVGILNKESKQSQGKALRTTFPRRVRGSLHQLCSQMPVHQGAGRGGLALLSHAMEASTLTQSVFTQSPLCGSVEVRISRTRLHRYLCMHDTYMCHVCRMRRGGVNFH